MCMLYDVTRIGNLEIRICLMNRGGNSRMPSPVDTSGFVIPNISSYSTLKPLDMGWTTSQIHTKKYFSDLRGMENTSLRECLSLFVRRAIVIAKEQGKRTAHLNLVQS